MTLDAGTEPEPEITLASWGARAGALSIDVLFGVALISTLGLLAWMAPLLWWLYTGLAAVAGLAVMVNRWVLPPRTGWTLGRAITGIRVVQRDGAAGVPAGTGRLMLRDAAHLLDTAAVLLGWLWPLWDRRHRTFADLLARTEVHRVGEPARQLRRPVAVGLLVTALVAVVAAAAAYQLVYRQDRAVDSARTQIAAQGPRIVEQLLSYTPETLQGDFTRAQSLASDLYRPQLIAQQEALQQTPVVSNEYWTVNSAVLQSPEPTPTTASMLLALQGQRGSDPKTLRFITATVRVDFVNTGDRWQVQNLTVLTKPQAGGGGG
jgi:Mce-associated membrane protein